MYNLLLSSGNSHGVMSLFVVVVKGWHITVLPVHSSLERLVKYCIILCYAVCCFKKSSPHLHFEHSFTPYMKNFHQHFSFVTYLFLLLFCPDIRYTSSHLKCGAVFLVTWTIIFTLHFVQRNHSFVL